MAIEPTTSSTPEIFTYPTKRGIPLIPHHPGRRNRPHQPPQDPVTTQSMILTSIASTTEENINSTTETEDGTTPELTSEENSDESDTSDAEDTDDMGDVSDRLLQMIRIVILQMIRTVTWKMDYQVRCLEWMITVIVTIMIGCQAMKTRGNLFIFLFICRCVMTGITSMSSWKFFT